MTLKKKPDEQPVEPPTDEQIGALAAQGEPDAPAASSTPGSPDPWAVLAQIAAAMTALAANATNSESSQAIQVLTQTVARLADASISGSKMIADAQIKARRPSNEVVPEISVFNRRGRDPHLEDGNNPEYHKATIKPPLKCEMFFPWILEWESLTREEVQLLNLLEDGSYVVLRNDRSKVSLTVQIQYREDNRTPSKLFVNHETAFNQDNYRNFPALSDTLRMMLKQHDLDIRQKSALILTDEEEEALIEAGSLSVTH